MISCTDHAGFDWFIFDFVCFFIKCYSLHHAHLKVLWWSVNIYGKTRDHKWSPHVMKHFFSLNTFTLTCFSQAEVTCVPLHQMSVKHIHQSGVTIQLKTIAHPEYTTHEKCTILEWQLHPIIHNITCCFSLLNWTMWESSLTEAYV